MIEGALTVMNSELLRLGSKIDSVQTVKTTSSEKTGGTKTTTSSGKRSDIKSAFTNQFKLYCDPTKRDTCKDEFKELMNTSVVKVVYDKLAPGMDLKDSKQVTNLSVPVYGAIKAGKEKGADAESKKAFELLEKVKSKVALDLAAANSM
jgi:hypothetical protein